MVPLGGSFDTAGNVLEEFAGGTLPAGVGLWSPRGVESEVVKSLCPLGQPSGV